MSGNIRNIGGSKYTMVIQSLVQKIKHIQFLQDLCDCTTTLFSIHRYYRGENIYSQHYKPTESLNSINAMPSTSTTKW